MASSRSKHELSEELTVKKQGGNSYPLFHNIQYRKTQPHYVFRDIENRQYVFNQIRKIAKITQLKTFICLFLNISVFNA